MEEKNFNGSQNKTYRYFIHGFAVLIIFLLILFFSYPFERSSNYQSKNPSSEIHYISAIGNNLIRDKLLMSDHEVLFFENPYSATYIKITEDNTIEDGLLFKAFEDQLLVQKKMDYFAVLPKKTINLEVKSYAIDAQTIFTEVLKTKNQMSFDPSFLRIQVTNLENKVSRSQLISQGVENEILLKKLWEPTIINAHIDSLGVIGTPIIISSSGSDEVDAVLLKVTKEQFEKVDFIPGFYEMKISI